MCRIVLEDAFVVPAVLSAYELYNQNGPDGRVSSAEALGSLWGHRDGMVWTVRYVSITQSVTHRDEDSVEGPTPFDELTHAAWAAYDISGCNYLGGFHSHAYPNVEMDDGLFDNWTEPSEDDESAMPIDVIELIVSLVPSASVPTEYLEWAQRGDRVSGRVDVAYVAISGWYNDEEGVADEVRVEWPGSAGRPFGRP